MVLEIKNDRVSSADGDGGYEVGVRHFATGSSWSIFPLRVLHEEV
jgi:hypothetical protein